MNDPEPDRQPSAPDSRRIKVSGTDWLVLWSTLFLTIALDRLAFPGWWLPAMVVAHFFVFCNVVKVPRKLEILWALVFVINSGLWFAVENFDWRPVLLTQSPFTLAAVGMTLIARRRAAPAPQHRAT